MKKELQSGILSVDKSADGRPTVGGANVIAVLTLKKAFIVAKCLQTLIRVLSMRKKTHFPFVVCAVSPMKKLILMFNISFINRVNNVYISKCIAKISFFPK